MQDNAAHPVSPITPSPPNSPMAPSCRIKDWFHKIAPGKRVKVRMAPHTYSGHEWCAHVGVTSKHVCTSAYARAHACAPVQVYEKIYARAQVCLSVRASARSPAMRPSTSPHATRCSAPGRAAPHRANHEPFGTVQVWWETEDDSFAGVVVAIESGMFIIVD